MILAEPWRKETDKEEETPGFQVNFPSELLREIRNSNNASQNQRSADLCLFIKFQGAQTSILCFLADFFRKEHE